MDQEKCLPQHAVTVEMNVKYHSSQKTTDMFIAENVSKITDKTKLFWVTLKTPLILLKQRFRINHQYQTSLNSVPARDKIKIGMPVQIVQKQDQSTGNLTEGIIKRILTSSNFHPHGIKVELDNGKIGRVQNIIHKWR